MTRRLTLFGAICAAVCAAAVIYLESETARMNAAVPTAQMVTRVAETRQPSHESRIEPTRKPHQTVTVGELRERHHRISGAG